MTKQMKVVAFQCNLQKDFVFHLFVGPCMMYVMFNKYKMYVHFDFT